jgi:threonyl-tRNA synthetase
LDVVYVDASGARKRPAMLHRALFGSLERFLAIVIEQHRGRMPPWLSPEQVRVIPLRSAEREAAEVLLRELRDRGVRAALDEDGEGISKRVALAHAAEVPFVAVLGPREVSTGSVDLRSREGRDVVPRNAVIERLVDAARAPW